MKKILLPALSFLSLCFAISSCDNGVYDMTPSVDKSHTANPLIPRKDHAGGVLVTATINGSFWSSRVGYMDYVKGEPYIYGSWQPGDITTVQQISLSFANYHGVGIYYFNADGGATWLIDSVTTASTYGQVVVDSDANGIIKGTFNFEGQDLIVSNGLFKVIKW